ncbi:CRISPR-associated protein Cas4 [Ktedonospora formicarum]|uniref:CRISPR-associated exonuclease Cas4 n=1 Tax=Ktedonospora formicarum TaxID=2778364 RepID=A0A8J3I6Q4_9CHLR|nr:CRISPR-associated protein Cas4 [Ktedonospora formicarum]GHO49671.1 CRISPR-associated protein Cas4 [Ktedonospora formicarum]
MSEPWLLEVTDLKQYLCCPRIPYYRYCLPDIRPVTYSMEVGIQSHREEEEKEARRSLQKYQIEQGERLFNYFAASELLGIKGQMDLVIITPSWEAEDKEAIIVDYKYSEQKAGPHFKLQLAAYALLLEEELQMPVRNGFLYSIPLRKAEKIAITVALRKKVRHVIQEIHQLLEREAFPVSTRTPHRCPTCEFRRFCNDMV